MTSAYNAAVLLRQQSTIVDVSASLSIAAESIRTSPTHESVVWRSHIYAAHSLETRSLLTAISVHTHCTAASVARTTRAAVASRTLVVAYRVRVAVMLSCVTRPNLDACLLAAQVGKCVASVAVTDIRVRTSVGTAAEAARIVNAVIDVCASLSIPREAIWAGAARVALRWRRQVVTLNASETRRLHTAIPIAALYSIASVTCAARAAVASRALVVAYRVRVAVMLACVTRPNLNACGRACRVDTNCVASVAVTRVLPDSDVNAVAVQSTGGAIAVGIVAGDPSRICALCKVDHP